MKKVKCDISSFTPISPTTVRISGGTNNIRPYYDGRDIVSLEFPDEKVISVGEILPVKGKDYKINIIKKSTRRKVIYYDLKIAEKTKSSIFVTPMLGGTRKLWMYDQLLINAFIGIQGYNSKHIVLLYRQSEDPLFIKFLQTIQKFKSFKDLEFTGTYVVVEFNVPKGHQVNFRKFMHGEYSKLDTEFKMKILDYHSMDIDNIIGQILFKTGERKKKLEDRLGVHLSPDAELYSIPELKKETLNLNYYL